MKSHDHINYFLRFIIGVICIGIGSCKKFVTVPPGGGTTSTETVFANDSSAMEAVTGIYIQAMNTNSTLLNGMGVYLALSSDELTVTNGNANELQFYFNTLSPSNIIVNTNAWKSGYANIYHINACIEQLANSKNITDTLRTRLSAESKFMRALTYFYLVNLFGKVPLVTQTSMDTNRIIPRALVSDVYNQVLADLQDAYYKLPDVNDNTHPTKMAAAALLARVNCYLKDYQQAAMYSNIVINDSRHHLANNLDSVFLAVSPETIFQLAPVLQNNSTSEGLSFIPVGNAAPKYYATSSLLADFDPGDNRKSHWLKLKSVGPQAYYYPYKYKISRGNPTATEYNVVLRLAEQYLIRAEAEANPPMNDFAAAAADLDIIRNRAGLPPIPVPTNLDTCKKAIAKERRIELLAEWGHRWLDLKRTGAADTVLKSIKSTWTITSQLFPIPLSEIQLDPNLTQNPGYY